MTNKEAKANGYEMQGIAMSVKGHLISLAEYPDQLQSAQDVRLESIISLDLLIAIAMETKSHLIAASGITERKPTETDTRRYCG